MFYRATWRLYRRQRRVKITIHRIDHRAGNGSVRSGHLGHCLGAVCSSLFLAWTVRQEGEITLGKGGTGDVPRISGHVLLRLPAAPLRRPRRSVFHCWITCLFLVSRRGCWLSRDEREKGPSFSERLQCASPSDELIQHGVDRCLLLWTGLEDAEVFEVGKQGEQDLVAHGGDLHLRQHQT